jgi:hypothetical protein
MLRKLLLALACATLFPAAGHAAAVAVTGIGPRIGISSSPDQIVLGGQLTISDIAPDVSFVPSLEFGFGDNQTDVGFNFDLNYGFHLTGSPWRPYVGAGIGVNVQQVDRQPPLRDDSNTDTGGNLIIGAGVPTRSGSRFFTEARVGVGDIPSLKIMAGWNFNL